MGKIQTQLRTVGLGGIATGVVIAWYSPHSVSNVPFLIGVVTMIFGILVLAGK